MGYVSEFKLINSKYNKDFSQEVSGTVPSGFSTHQSNMTSSFVEINHIQTV